MQLPKELRLLLAVRLPRAPIDASMKCSSQRNCDMWSSSLCSLVRSLNEVQFPKELRRRG